MTVSLEPLARRWAWAWFLGYGLMAIIGYRLIPPGLERDVAYVLIGLTGVAAIGLGLVLHRPAYRLPWYLIGAGQLLWVIGDAIGTWLLHGLGLDRFPSAADICYLLAYPVLTAGLYLLVRRRIPRHDLGGLLDSLIVTVALGLLLWVLLVEPTALGYQGSWTATAVALAYPAGDLLLVGLLVRLITTPGGWNPSLRLLSVAVVLLIGADTTATALNLLAFDSASAFDFVWLMSYVVWGAAALHPSMYAVAEPAPEPPARFSRRRLVALTLAVLVAPVTLAVQQLVGRPLDVWAVVIASLLMFLAVVGRMKVAIDQIVAANRLREQAQADLAHQAAHDPLTGLPNRSAGLRLIDDALGQARLRGTRAGLLFIDLDEFKRVNDTLGHGAGDAVLREVASLMRAAVRRGDVVARLGGDEFVVLLQPLDDEAAAVKVADRIVTALSRPIVVGNGYRVRIGASIGVAVGSEAGTDAETLLREADAALYRAKASGRSRVEVFDRTLRAELSHRASAGTGAGPGDRAGRAGAALPADRLRRQRRGARLRGTGPLASAGRHVGPAAGLRPGRGVLGPHLRSGCLGDGPGGRAAGSVEHRTRLAGSDRVGERLRPAHRPVPVRRRRAGRSGDLAASVRTS